MSEYDKLLARTPDHLSEAFIEFLRTNDPDAVVKELTHWIIVENVKYHHKEGYSDHWTAFYKEPRLDIRDVVGEAWSELYDWIPTHRQLLVNRKSDRSIERFHLHIIK